MSSEQEVDSRQPLDRYMRAWTVMGFTTDGKRTYSSIPNRVMLVVICIYYPIHLIIGLAFSANREQLFRNLVMNMASITCSLKHFAYRYNLQRMPEITNTLSMLDKRIRTDDDRAIFRKNTLYTANFMSVIFYVLYGFVCVFSLLTVLTAKEWHLLYPGWWPFDWKASLTKYIIANGYQFIGLVIEAHLNYTNDAYAPISFCVFAGHIRQLRIRAARIGHNECKFSEDRHQELKNCIQDYNALMRIFYQLEKTVSMFVLIQFLSSAITICLSLFYLLFYADSIYSIGYNGLQLIAFFGELFPCCYYGSIVELEFQKLPYAISTADWLGQSPKFRRDVLLFTTLATKNMKATAFGLVNIHLTTFFSTCKMAYSCFTLILSMGR